MKNGKMNFCEAAKYVQSQRSCIYPNFGFCKQLIEYEKELDLLKEKLTESNLSWFKLRLNILLYCVKF